MGKKINEESGPPKEVKSKITVPVFDALELISNTIGRSHSDVIKTALSDYIFKNYPNFIKKTDMELRIQAEEEVLLSEYKIKFSKKKSADEFVPLFEESQKKRWKEIRDVHKKINTKRKELKKHLVTKKQKEVEDELEELETELSGLRNEEDTSEPHFQMLKRDQKF